LEAAQAEAKEFHILHQGGECADCEPPEIIGPGIAPRIAMPRQRWKSPLSVLS
jgi:hypothetical protein